MTTTIPSPADAPTMSAQELIDHIRSHGGRVIRWRLPPYVIALTHDPELVGWLVERKGRPFSPVGMGIAHDGSYLRARGGKKEWDIVISAIPVTDIDEAGHAIWKAAV